MFLDLLGIISALGAASSWTYACFLWRRQTKYFSASQINIIKNIIAFLIFFPFLLTIDFQSRSAEIFILLLSGVIGIAIGDSFYIISLKILGTRNTLTVEALSPILATILGSFLLNEMLSLQVYLGILIVSISLIGVVLQKTVDNNDRTSSLANQKGFVFAFLSVFCAVIAATLSRLVLTNSDLNPFQTTEIRLLGSIVALIPFSKKNIINSIEGLSFENKSRLLYATFLGTNVGILLQQNVFKILPIGLGWTLLSTSPAIALFFAREEGEEINGKTLILTATIILGIYIVFI